MKMENEESEEKTEPVDSDQISTNSPIKSKPTMLQPMPGMRRKVLARKRAKKATSKKKK